MNIIFDLDGTLIDSSERMYQLFKELVPQCQFSKQQYWNLKRDKITHELIIKRYFSQINYEEFDSKWMSLIETKEYLKFDKVFDNTIPVLEELKNIYSLQLLTARQSRKELISELDEMNLYQYFDHIFITEARQTKEQILNDAIRKSVISKMEGDILIGDMGKDILLGKREKYKTIAVTYGFMNKKRLLQYSPDVVIDNLTDLVKLLCDREQNEEL